MLTGTKQETQWDLTKKKKKIMNSTDIKTKASVRTELFAYLTVMILRIYGLFREYITNLANNYIFTE